MSTLKICAMVLTVLVCLNFVACGSNKTDEKSEPTTITTTLGQELQDLEKAYKDGIITEKEYEKAKQKIIEQRTK